MAANKSFRCAISKASLPYYNPAPEWRILRKAIIQFASITQGHFLRRESISDTDKKLLTKLLDKLIGLIRKHWVNTVGTRSGVLVR